MNDENKVQGSWDWLDEDDIALQNFGIACDVEDCDYAAEWFMLHTCCEKVFLGCESHTGEAVHWLYSMDSQGRPIHCGYCSKTKNALEYMTNPQPISLQM